MRPKRKPAKPATPPPPAPESPSVLGEVAEGLLDVGAGLLATLDPRGWQPSTWAGRGGEWLAEKASPKNLLRAASPLAVFTALDPVEGAVRLLHAAKAVHDGRERVANAVADHLERVGNGLLDSPAAAQLAIVKPVSPQLADTLAGPRKARSLGRLLGVAAVAILSLLAGKAGGALVGRVAGALTSRAATAEARTALAQAETAALEREAADASREVAESVASRAKVAPQPSAPVEAKRATTTTAVDTEAPAPETAAVEAPARDEGTLDGLAQRISPETPRGGPEEVASPPPPARAPPAAAETAKPAAAAPERNLGALGDEPAAPARKSLVQRVCDVVKGLWESIHPDEAPRGWSFKHLVWLEDGKVWVRTLIRGPGVGADVPENELPFIERIYDPENGEIVMNNAFLKNLPRRILGTAVELQPGKGVPTQAYVTIAQMKKIGVAFGELKKLQMHQIQNLETVIQLAKAAERGESLDAAVLESKSLGYAETTLRQSGHSLKEGTAHVDLTNAVEEPVGKLMDWQTSRQLVTPEECERLLAKYGVDRSYVVRRDFNIEVELTPAKH